MNELRRPGGSLDASQTALVAAIADDLPLGVCVASADSGALIYTNPAFHELLGVAPGCIVGGACGRCSFTSLEGEPLERDRMPFRRALTEGKALVTGDFWLRGHQGRRRMLRALAKPLLDIGGAPRFVAMAFTDVTSDFEASRELKRAERQLRYVVDHAPVILFGFDNDGRVTLSEGRGLESLGWKAGELVGQSVWELYKDAPEALDAARRAIAGEEFQTTTHANGVTFDAVFAPLFGADGKQVGVTGVTINVTERDRQRQERAQADRMGALGTLAASVAHEVNTPLTYIGESLKHVLDVLPQLEDGKDLPHRIGVLSALLEDAQHGLEQVKVIASDLHAFSRPEERVTAVELGKVLKAAIRMASNETRHRARLTVEFSPLPRVMGNEGRLAQVFLNLLTNAAQAIPEGNASAHEIRVVGRAVEGSAVIEISDTGRGIAPEVLPRIFEPFFTTKAVGSGTGLGLAVSRSIVESLGGRIEVESAPGKGTRFRVRLPVAPPTAAIHERPLAIPAVRPRVLIVDDNEALARVLKVTLQEHCELELVGSGRLALERLLGSGRYDLVLCDLMMPDVTGIDVYEAVREKQPGLERSICFMTGGAFTPRAQAFLGSVQNRCFQKPFDFAEVILRELEARSAAA